MNTRLIMTACAIIMGAIGLFLTFAPDVAVLSLDIESNKAAIFMMQILGAFYFAFAMLNWMNKKSPIGGIYNRPVAVANFTHFLIAGLALAKGIISDAQLPVTIWIIAAVYIVFGILFGLILFRQPKENN